MIVYLDMRTGTETYGDAFNHRGQRVGSWSQTSTWTNGRHRATAPTMMHAIQLAYLDGSEWTGSARISHPYRVRVKRKKHPP